MRVFVFLFVLSGCASIERLAPNAEQDASVFDFDSGVLAESDAGAMQNQPDADSALPDATVDVPDATVNVPDATVMPTCEDGEQNGDETGVDCGGDTCDPCAVESVCDGQGGLWCRAFEGEAYTPVPGYTGTLEVVASDPYRGQGVLRAQSSGAGEFAALQASFAPVSSGDIFLRSYVKIPAAVPRSHFDIFTLEVPATATEVSRHCAVAMQQDQLLLWCSDVGPLAQVDVDLTRDQWVCVEWKLSVGVQGISELFVDGTSVASGVGATDFGRSFEESRIGIPYTGASQGNTELLFDELIIDTQRVGCD